MPLFSAQRSQPRTRRPGRRRRMSYGFTSPASTACVYDAELCSMRQQKVRRALPNSRTHTAVLAPIGRLVLAQMLIN